MQHNELVQKAEKYIRQFYQEMELNPAQCEIRLLEINEQIMQAGSYTQTPEELQYGARLAWRNSNRCIGRLFWNSLQVFDARESRTKDEVIQSLLHHIDYATNDGKIRSTVTVFSPKGVGKDPVRIYNHQLIRYAGYQQSDGSIIGDPHSVEFTRLCERLGWRGDKTKYDILPIVIQLNEEDPFFFELPESLVKEVDIIHPDKPAINELGLKWYAVPIISEMKLEIGGLEYIAAPFNGWYMETEISARNFADESRYNELPAVAKKLKLSTQYQSSFWKDRALIELSQAVLHSFKEAGVSMVDHHTASQQFALFEEKEKSEGREITGDWTWLIPPISPASTHIFHHSYNNTWKSPNFFYQESFFQSSGIENTQKCPFHLNGYK